MLNTFQCIDLTVYCIFTQYFEKNWNGKTGEGGVHPLEITEW